MTWCIGTPWVHSSCITDLNQVMHVRLVKLDGFIGHRGHLYHTGGDTYFEVIYPKGVPAYLKTRVSWKNPDLYYRLPRGAVAQ